MYKSLNVLFILLLVGFKIFAQQSISSGQFKSSSTVKNSVLAQGSWYKFAIDTTGIIKIDRQFLQGLGIDVNTLNPKNIRIYGNGGVMLPTINNEFRYDGLQENAIYISGEEDNSFDAGDYILFYGVGPDNWEYNEAQPQLSTHRKNIYSDKAFYFITTDNGAGKRITNANIINSTADMAVTTYTEFKVFEEETINLFGNGQQWFGKDLSYENSTTIHFDFTALDTTKPIYINTRGVSISSTLSQLLISANDQELAPINFANIPSGSSLTLAIPGSVSNSTNVASNSVAITLSYNNNGNPSAKAYIDFVEVIGTKQLLANGHQFYFKSFEAANSSTSTTLDYTIANAVNIDQVWDVTDHLNPKIIENQGSGTEFIFKDFGGTLKTYAILNEEDLYEPEFIENSRVDNQNLHSLQDIDYLIITQSYLMEEAESIASHHRQNNNLTTRVVDLQQIYNEFSSGAPDITAIRDFVRHLYTNSGSLENRIKYVCLFGDASYDFKDRINSNNNVVPAYQSYESFDLARSYVTDDYFGMMDDDEGSLSVSDRQDVATGRIPVTSVLEAQQVVSKILSYYDNTSFGDWRNRIALVADDPDSAGEFVLQQTVERIADTITVNKPVFNLSKIYADAYVQETSAGGERYPDVNTAIDNAIESGSLIMNYFGHGGEDGWAQERILGVEQIKDWNNNDHLPLLITVTCEFSRFDNPLRPTAGEFVFLNPNGGAASMITTTREIFISVGQRYNEVLMKKLLSFNDEDYTISEALMAMKNDPDAPSTSQRLFVYYLGDPAMKLAQPTANIKLTKLNDKDITQAPDSLKALSRITMEGIITDIEDNLLTDFNGTVSTTIFDKSVDKSTLDNNGFGNTMTFDAIESKIFRGRASVNNGSFKLEFVVPKDIRIAYGKAKISMYADNNSIDKAGLDGNIIIGGINENAPEDTTGPTIQLFMDDESFVDGGNTSQSPYLLALLEDNSGINTSITSVDHDIIAILDGDQANPYVLNDFYQTELDDFTKGKVKFPFRDLEPGIHTIQFKCWDTYNNPSEATLNFIVVNDNDLVLSNVLNYPNPLINYTEFWFNHNKPNEPLDVMVQLFTVSGKLIRTITQTVQSENLSRSVTWDGLDDFGNKIGKGVYIYKLIVKSTLTNSMAEKIEKLVILQ